MAAPGVWRPWSGAQFAHIWCRTCRMFISSCCRLWGKHVFQELQLILPKTKAKLFPCQGKVSLTSPALRRFSRLHPDITRELFEGSCEKIELVLCKLAPPHPTSLSPSVNKLSRVHLGREKCLWKRLFLVAFFRNLLCVNNRVYAWVVCCCVC